MLSLLTLESIYMNNSKSAKFIFLSLILGFFIIAALILVGKYELDNTYSSDQFDAEEIGLPIIKYTCDTSLDDLRADKNLVSHGFVEIFDCYGNHISSSQMYLKGHGNTFPDENILKKSWTFRFDKDTSILGMNPGKKYVAISNTSDPSQLRNKITFEFARELGLEYTPNAEYALLYINDELQGLYLISEKIDVAAGRIDLDSNSQNNIKKALTYVDNVNLTKGYISSATNDSNDVFDTGLLLHEEGSPERYDNMLAGFAINEDRFVEIQYPQYPDQEFVSTIADRIRMLQAAIESEDGCATDINGNPYHYSDLIDLDSYIKKYFIEQLSKNRDGNNASSYYYMKNVQYDSTLYAGPVWDYDKAYGGYFLNPMYAKPQGLINLLPKLDRRPEFMELVKQYYTTIFRPYLDSRGMEIINEQADYIEKAVELDRNLWGVYGATDNDNNDSPNPIDLNATNVWDYRVQSPDSVPSFRSEVDFLSNFIFDRLEYLDKTWIDNQEFCRVNYVANDEIIHTEWVPKGSPFPDYVPTHLDLLKVAGGGGISPELTDRQFVGWYEDGFETPIELESLVDEDFACWGKWE